MKPLKHWQDVVNVALGAWLLLSPWVLDFAAETAAMTSMVVMGAALIAAALGAILVPRAWEEWIECVLGLCVIVSPWVLGFESLEARSSAVLTGVAVVVLALWTIFVDEDYSTWRRKERPAQ